MKWTLHNTVLWNTHGLVNYCTLPTANTYLLSEIVKVGNLLYARSAEHLGQFGYRLALVPVLYTATSLWNSERTPVTQLNSHLTLLIGFVSGGSFRDNVNILKNIRWSTLLEGNKYYVLVCRKETKPISRNF